MDHKNETYAPLGFDPNFIANALRAPLSARSSRFRVKEVRIEQKEARALQENDLTRLRLDL